MTRCRYDLDGMTCYNKAVGYLKIHPDDKIGRTGKLKIPVCKMHLEIVFDHSYGSLLATNPNDNKNTRDSNVFYRPIKYH